MKRRSNADRPRWPQSHLHALAALLRTITVISGWCHGGLTFASRSTSEIVSSRSEAMRNNIYIPARRSQRSEISEGITSDALATSRPTRIFSYIVRSLRRGARRWSAGKLGRWIRAKDRIFKNFRVYASGESLRATRNKIASISGCAVSL